MYGQLVQSWCLDCGGSAVQVPLSSGSQRLYIVSSWARDLLGLVHLETLICYGEDSIVGKEAPMVVARKQRENSMICFLLSLH